VANISYFDVNAEPQHIGGSKPAMVVAVRDHRDVGRGRVVAQGDSDSIGCRIIVDDEVKAERISNQVNAFASCLLKSA
jgi:hypothetical protein